MVVDLDLDTDIDKDRDMDMEMDIPVSPKTPFPRLKHQISEYSLIQYAIPLQSDVAGSDIRLSLIYSIRDI
jgi:hypothetical protein